MKLTILQGLLHQNILDHLRLPNKWWCFRRNHPKVALEVTQ